MSKIFTYDPGTDVWGEAAVLPSPVVSRGSRAKPWYLLHLGEQSPMSKDVDSMLGSYT